MRRWLYAVLGALVGCANPNWVKVEPVLSLRDKRFENWDGVIRAQGEPADGVRRYALLSNSGARRPIRKLISTGSEKQQPRRISETVWLTPIVGTSQREFELRAEVETGTIPFLEAVGVFPDHEIPKDPDKLLAFAAQFDLIARIRDLDEQLKRARDLDESRQAACRMFVWFDFLCTKAVHTNLAEMGDISAHRLLELAGLTQRGVEPHDRTEEVLQTLTSPQTNCADPIAILTRARKVLLLRIKGASQNKEVVEPLRDRYKFLDQLAPFAQNCFRLGSRARRVSGGLVHPEDLLRFAQGELSIPSHTEMMNGEPNSAAFFMLTEMCIRCLNRFKTDEWEHWSRTGIAAELLFVESYLPSGSRMTFLEDYWKKGPLDSTPEHRERRRREVVEQIKDTPREKLLDTHKAIIFCAFNPSHGTCSGGERIIPKGK